MPSNAEWAWIAGLFEGEGCIRVRGRKVTLVIQMCDEDVLKTLERLVPSPSGLRAGATRTDTRRAIFTWYICRKETILDFLDHVEPWLHGRRKERVQEARTALARNRGITRDGPSERPKRVVNGRMNPEYERWRYRRLRAAGVTRLSEDVEYQHMLQGRRVA